VAQAVTQIVIHRCWIYMYVFYFIHLSTLFWEGVRRFYRTLQGVHGSEMWRIMVWRIEVKIPLCKRKLLTLRYSCEVCHTPAWLFIPLPWDGKWMGFGLPCIIKSPLRSYFQTGTNSLHNGHSCSWSFSNVTTALDLEFPVLNVS
jgi:hypothetical protein